MSENEFFFHEIKRDGITSLHEIHGMQLTHQGHCQLDTQAYKWLINWFGN